MFATNACFYIHWINLESYKYNQLTKIVVARYDANVM